MSANRVSLQEQVDRTPAGATLKLDAGREFQGPVVINHALTIEGQGATIWATEGPVVSVQADGVHLQKLNVEVTSNETTLADEAACALVVGADAGVTLSTVSVRGNVLGLDSETGDWSYPRVLQLGKMKAGRPHEFKATLVVPVPCSLHSGIDGLRISPARIDASGTVTITINVEPLAAGTLVRGEIELRTALLTRRINVSGNVPKRDEGTTANDKAQVIYTPPPPDAKKTAAVPAPKEPRKPDTVRDDSLFLLSDAIGPMPASAKTLPGTQTLTVSKLGAAEGEGHYRTLEEAIRKAQPGTRIQVKPGLYKEAVLIDKDLEIIGDGPRADIQIESAEGSCLRLAANHGLVRGLTLRAAGRGSKERFAVAILRGEVVLEDCDISSDSLACVGIHGSAAQPTLRGCTIHDGKSAGVLIYDGAKALLEDCDIFGHALACVEIKQGGAPVLRKCRIHHGQQVGVLVHDKGKGVLEECDIFNNALAGVEIARHGDPTLRACRIHDGDHPGIRVHDQGAGTVENCTIEQNAGAGVEVKQGARPVIRECRIAAGKQSGVLFCGKGQGRLENCRIEDNALAGVEIRQGSDPVLRKCKVSGNRAMGVLVQEQGQGILDNCDIAENAGAGVEIREGGKPVLRQCQIHGNQQAGLLALENGEGTIENCQIHANGWAGVAILSGANPSLRDCEIRDGQHAGLVAAYQGAGTLEKCQIIGNTLMGVVIAVGGKPVLRGCRIKGNKDVGVWAFDDAAGAVENCELIGNDGGPDNIAEGCRVRLQNNKTD